MAGPNAGYTRKYANLFWADGTNLNADSYTNFDTAANQPKFGTSAVYAYHGWYDCAIAMYNKVLNGAFAWYMSDCGPYPWGQHYFHIMCKNVSESHLLMLPADASASSSSAAAACGTASNGCAGFTNAMRAWCAGPIEYYPQPTFPTNSGCLPANTTYWMTTPQGKHYRLYHTHSYNWDQAAAYCLQNGGYLVTYHTRQEQLDVEVSVGRTQETGPHACTKAGAPAQPCAPLCQYMKLAQDGAAAAEAPFVQALI